MAPSAADLALAARVYEAGLGTGIVDNQGRSLYVVVEPPPTRIRNELDPDDVGRHLVPGGTLESRFRGYEHRPSQLQMLREVTKCYNQGGVAVLEAGTGTGKSLAYLLPAAAWTLANQERTIISTNTINLQEQLAGKDLPLVQDLLGEDFRWSLVKGRGNYVSLRRLLLAEETAPTLFDTDRGEELAVLVEWGLRTDDGSLSDLTTRPTEEIWEEVRSDGDICFGARCPHFRDCFYQRARREAHAADLLVVNHALLFADLSLRRATNNWSHSAVLPVYRHLVLDEAHNIEEAATLHLGAEVTRTGMFRMLGRLERRSGRGLLRSVEVALATHPAGQGEGLLEEIRGRLRPAVVEARRALRDFFTTIEPLVPAEEEEPLRLGRKDPRDPGEDPEMLERLDALRASFARLEGQVRALRARIEEDTSLSDSLEGRVLDLLSVERRLETANRGLGLVFTPDTEWVRWIEGRGRAGSGPRNVVLAAAPIEPGAILRDSLFGRMEATIVTSATLATGEGFGFIRSRLGLGDDTAPSGPSPSPKPVVKGGREGRLRVTERRLASPFSYQKQAIFCVPTDLPPQDGGPVFQAATARVVVELAEMTGGGLFVLFTSYRALRSVARRIRDGGSAGGHRLLVHGEMPRFRLLQRFVAAGDAILLGTASFWEGVDVPGDALRGLILQKIPFRVPTEPITQARMEAIEARGARAFDAYQVPHAALRLKQGFGRLVRSREDRGAVLLLDSRILTRSYGRALRSALPPAPLVKGDWAAVRPRLAEFYSGP